MPEMDELERIDCIRERTGLGYAEARRLLAEAGGDVVQALISYEKHRSSGKAIGEAGLEALAKLKGMLRTGNVTRIRVKKDDKVVMEMPITAGVIGAVLAPELALLGAAACLFGKCTVEFEKADGAGDYPSNGETPGSERQGVEIGED